MLISAFCFFRNEADMLPRTVPSWAPFVDELVLVDTGSTDGGDDYARKLALASPIVGPDGHELTVRFERLSWPDPLDWAGITNACAELCTAPWVLRLDADEPLVGNPEKLRGWIDLLDAGLACGVAMAVFEPDGDGWKNVCYRSRLHRWADGWRYRYRIDPEPVAPDGALSGGILLLEPSVVATLHLRVSWRPESLARAEGVLELAERLDGPLDERARAHYQNAIDRARIYAPKAPLGEGQEVEK